MYAQSAANAFIVIDDRDAAIDTVFHGDGLFRAVLCAQSAADAGNAAVSHSGFAFFTVVALDQNLVRSLHHFNEELRARGGTGTAANAFIIVELGQAIFSHGQGAEAAGINAGATAKAAKVALARAASGSRGEEAVLDAFPFVFGRAVFFAPIAVEEAAKVLQKEGGFQTALINAGGNIKVLGEKPDHKPWRIGIQDPKDPEKVLGTLSVPPGTAIATSGDYQRYYEVSGVRYHHILNPQTGWPSRNAHSVTVVTQSAFWADFYSTLLFVMTPKDAMTLVENNPSLEMVYQDLDGTLHISSGLKDLFVQGQ